MNYTQSVDAYLARQPPGFLQQDRSGNIIAVAVTFMALECVAIVLRTLARHLNRIHFERADVLMICSLVSNLAVGAGTIVITRFGAGKHLWVVSDDDWVRFSLTADYGLTCAYVLAVTFPKLALLDLYLHVFVSKRARNASYATAIVLIVNVMVNLPIIITQCRPIAAAWNAANGECIDSAAYRALASLPNIATDVVMAILPIPTIWALQVTKRVKISISLTFLVGSLGVITSIIRFLQFFEFQSLMGTIQGDDQTWMATNVLIWTIVEPGVYHLTACSISFRPLGPWLRSHRPFSSFASPYHRYTATADSLDKPRQRSDESGFTRQWPSDRLSEHSRSQEVRRNASWWEGRGEGIGVVGAYRISEV